MTVFLIERMVSVTPPGPAGSLPAARGGRKMMGHEFHQFEDFHGDFIAISWVLKGMSWYVMVFYSDLRWDLTGIL